MYYNSDRVVSMWGYYTFPRSNIGSPIMSVNFQIAMKIWMGWVEMNGWNCWIFVHFGQRHGGWRGSSHQRLPLSHCFLGFPSSLYIVAKGFVFA